MLKSGITKKLLTLVIFLILIFAAYLSSFNFSSAHALSFFGEFGAMNYVESVGFVLLMALMSLFVSEIVMIFLGKAMILSKCDFIEKFTFRLSFGLALIVLALEVTYYGGTFLGQIAWAITLMGAFLFSVRNGWWIVRRFVSITQSKQYGRMHFDLQSNIGRAKLALLVGVFVLIGILFLQAPMIINGYFGSTNFDASYHTLIIKSYLDMNRIVERPQPYYNFIIRYSRGPYALGAYGAFILSGPVHKMVTYLTVFFFAVNLLALYTLGKTVFGSQWMGLLVLVLGSSSQNLMSPISWGGLPFAMGLFSTLIGLSLTLRFAENARGLRDAALVGLILFLSIFSYPTSVLFTFVWLFFCLTAVLTRGFYLRKKAKLHIQARRLVILSFLAIALAFSLSLTFIFTFNNELQSWLINPTQGSFPETVTAQPEYTEEVQWVMGRVKQLNPFNPVDIFSFSLLHGFLLFFASVSPFAIIILWLLKNPRDIKDENASKTFPIYLRAVLFYLLFIFTVFFLRDLGNIRIILGYPFNDLIPPARVFQSMFELLSILSAVSIYALVTMSIALVKIFLRRNNKENKRIAQLREFIHAPQFRRGRYALLLATCLTLYLSFSTAYYSEALRVEAPNFVANFRNIFGYFNRLSASDLSLMEWMRTNMSGNEVIFVNWQDGGEYISAVTGLKAVYVLSPLFESTRYQKAVTSLVTNPANRSAVEFIVRNFNVTHLFVGSNGQAPRWDAYRIVRSPYFELVKRYGESFLFKIRLSTRITHFSDSKNLVITSGKHLDIRRTES